MLLLTACETKQQTGTLLGAATGALVGSRFGGGSGRLIATGVGAVAGGFIGNKIGQNMDETDRLKMQQSNATALENSRTGSASKWSNPDTGNSGTITPRKTFTNDNGQPCREYVQSITVGGKTEQGYGTACRQADGSWKIVQ